MYKVFSCLLQYLQSVLTCLFRTRVILVCSLAFRVNGQFSLTSESARLHSTKLWKPVLIQKRHTCESWILYVEFVVDDPRNFTLLKKLEIVLRVQKTLKCAMALTFPWTFLQSTLTHGANVVILALQACAVDLQFQFREPRTTLKVPPAFGLNSTLTCLHQLALCALTSTSKRLLEGQEKRYVIFNENKPPTMTHKAVKAFWVARLTVPVLCPLSKKLLQRTMTSLHQCLVHPVLLLPSSEKENSLILHFMHHQRWTPHVKEKTMILTSKFPVPVHGHHQGRDTGWVLLQENLPNHSLMLPLLLWKALKKHLYAQPVLSSCRSWNPRRNSWPKWRNWSWIPQRTNTQ